jgi:hypothetical protein
LPRERGKYVQAALQEIRDIVAATALPVAVQQTVLSCFDGLPKLYAELSRTYETRFSDRIIATVGGMVRTLTTEEAGPDAAPLAATMVARLCAMHDRYGISVVLKPPPAAKVKRRPKVS